MARGATYYQFGEPIPRTLIRDVTRSANARRGGYRPPPLEKDCPPRPADDLCQCCGKRAFRFHLDHCHSTGAFRGWVCQPCNTGIGVMDNIERLEKRIAFLKKAKRIALIKSVHQGGGY
jgi:hypothetical protein